MTTSSRCKNAGNRMDDNKGMVAVEINFDHADGTRTKGEIRCCTNGGWHWLYRNVYRLPNTHPAHQWRQHAVWASGECADLGEAVAEVMAAAALALEGVKT